MFKAALTIIATLFLAIPAFAQESHKDHNAAAHDHSQHAGGPELVITPILPDELEAGKENRVILFVQDMQAWHGDFESDQE